MHYIFFWKKCDTFYLADLLDEMCEKNYNNDNRKIDKSSIAHPSCQFGWLLIAAVGKIFFFVILNFATCPIYSAWPQCPIFPYCIRIAIWCKFLPVGERRQVNPPAHEASFEQPPCGISLSSGVWAAHCGRNHRGDSEVSREERKI